jgi:hypothetical protein
VVLVSVAVEGSLFGTGYSGGRGFIGCTGYSGGTGLIGWYWFQWR